MIDRRRFAVIVIAFRFALNFVIVPANQVRGDDFSRAKTPNAVDIDDYPFLVHPDYELSRIAGEDLITRPTVCDWDDQGRLVVVESAGAFGSVEDQLESVPHDLVRLIDDDGDGVFDRRLVAAKNLSFYSGVLCDGDDIYVSAPPSIWKLTDADGDGVCESREVWHDGGTLTYCANDLHGPYKGPDGWIYWCKGAFGQQTHELSGGETLVSKAAHVLRKRPEGGPVEIVTSGGMDNPIELAFLASGDVFFTSTFLQHPSGGRRDGIALAVTGGVYGKDHNVFDGLLRTGDLLPVMTHLGPAAPSGLLRVRHGQPNTTDLVCAQFNLHRVSKHRLSQNGASYRTEDIDLVSSSRLDFHPTDVIEDTDGSLVFLDTGDWYDLCCPSSGAEGKRSMGGIYRLRKRTNDSVHPNDTNQPDWNTITATEAMELLSAAPSRVRDRAADWLVAHPQGALDQMKQLVTGTPPNDFIQQQLVWIVARIAGDGQFRAAAFQTMQQWIESKPSAEVIRTMFAAWIHQSGLEDFARRQLASSSDSIICRKSAEYLARHGNPSDIDRLFARLDVASSEDRILEHSLLYSAMRINSPDSVTRYLAVTDQNSSNLQRRGALVVLHQTAPDRLDADGVFGCLNSTDRRLSETASRILALRIPWADDYAGSAVKRLAAMDPNSSLRQPTLDVLHAWADTDAVRKVWRRLLEDAIDDPDQIDLLTSVKFRWIPEAWDRSAADLLSSTSVARSVTIAGWLASSDLSPTSHPAITTALLKRCRDESLSSADRLQIARALPRGLPPSKHRLSKLIVDAITGSGGPEAQQLATKLAGRLRIDAAASRRMMRSLPHADTRTIGPMITMIAGGDRQSAAGLLDQLFDVAAAKTLPEEYLVSAFKKHSDLQPQAQQVARELRAPPANIARSLVEINDRLPDGDAVRGMRVFHGSKAACGACHVIGDVGGDIGPELTRIGRSRTRMALLEAIVYPSQHISQGYRSTRILTDDGQVFSGIIRADTDTTITLATGVDRIITIDRETIEEQVESDVSIMPAGLDGSMSDQELADVLQLLTSQ